MKIVEHSLAVTQTHKHTPGPDTIGKLFKDIEQNHPSKLNRIQLIRPSINYH